MSRAQAEREAAAVFGRPALEAVQADPQTAEAALLAHAQAVHAAIRDLRPLLGDIRAAVAFGQSLAPEIRRGVIFLWLGYGRQALERQGLKHD